MRLEVKMQVTISYLINYEISILVILLQINCSLLGYTSNSSGLILQSSLRVSSFTQLLIFPLTNFWNRQYRLLPILPASCFILAMSSSTSFCDFSFFWMQERMSLMIFGTTLRFYICFDFFMRLLLAHRGLQSSSHCNLLEGEVGLVGRDFRLHSEDDGHSVGRGLRIIVSTTENFPSWQFCSFSQESDSG